MRKLAITLIVFMIFVASNAAIEIRIDPRVELVGVLEYFSLDSQSREEIFLSEGNYFVEELKKHFSTYSSHNAIKNLKKLNIKGFSVANFVKLIMYYDLPPELNQIIPFEPGFFWNISIDAKNKKKLIENLIESIRDFAKESDFGKYLNVYADELSMKTEMISQSIIKAGVSERLCDALNLNCLGKKFTAIFCSWLDGEIHFVSPSLGYFVVLGPEISRKGNPVFNRTGTIDKLIKGFSSLLVSEVVDSNVDVVQSLSDLYILLGDSAKSVCKDWVCAFKHQWAISIIPDVSTIKTPALIEIHKDYNRGFVFTPVLYFLTKQPINLGNVDTIDEFRARIVVPLINFLGQFEKLPELLKQYESQLAAEIWQHAKSEAQNLSFDDVSYIVFHFLKEHIADADELINTKMELSAGNDTDEMLYKSLSAAFKAETGELLEAESMAKDCLISTDSKRVKAYAYFALGIIAKNEGKVKKAEKMFIKASKLYPEISILKEHLMNLKEGKGNDNKPKKVK